MLQFVLCDDNFNILLKLENMLESIFINNNLDAKIAFRATNAEEILRYVQYNNVNVLILDIDLKSNISGLDLANIIRKKDKNVYIIFFTAHLEYGLVAYKYKTFDYIPKPVTMERLESTILRLFDDISTNPIKYLRLDNNKTIINEDTVKYIKKDGMKVIFHTDTRDYETYSSFKKISPKLPNNFIQCHKSYIVNTNKISEVQYSNNIVLFGSDTEKCYIGPKYKNKFMEVFRHANFSNNLDSFDNT